MMKKTGIILLTIILVFVLCIQIFAEKPFVAENAEDLTQGFINAMREKKYNVVRKLNMLDELGYYPQMYTTDSDVDFTKQEVLDQQYEYIISQFGQNAWENVSYQIIKTNCPEKGEEFVLKETSKILTKSEAKNVTKDFLKKIAKENNMTYDELINPTSSSGEKRKQNKIESYSDIILEEIVFPVEVNLVDLYDYYNVVLTFNDQSSTETGEHHFMISICNKDGLWRIYQGLTWIIPIDDDMEEIEDI